MVFMSNYFYSKRKIVETSGIVRILISRALQKMCQTLKKCSELPDYFVARFRQIRITSDGWGSLEKVF